MEKKSGILSRISSAYDALRGKTPAPVPSSKIIDDREVKGPLPRKRISVPGSGSAYPNVPNLLSSSHSSDKLITINHQFLEELIPVIRYLSIYNPDVSQALNNIVTLGNTGHQIHFDKSVPADQVEKMRNHLINKRKNWAVGQAGMNGLINKFFAQVMIGGASSAEWVPNADLTGIETCILVNPEDVLVKLAKNNSKYKFYQILRNTYQSFGNSKDSVELNPNTYRYFALNGDTEVPYGIPPYIPVVKKISTQGKMDKNIDFIVDQMGLLGFLEVMISKPDFDESIHKNEEVYDTVLENLLEAARSRILNGGLKEGVVVGYKEDHEFNYNSTNRSFESAISLYQENELQVASGVKQDAALWGRGYATSETQITVVFMKMLSELKNIQNVVKEMVEFGYSLELRLAGFKFDYLKIAFNRSTIQDDLKYQQAEEIKIRNVISKFLLGIISLETAAEELGYENPDDLKPRVPLELLAGKSGPGAGGSGDAEQKKKRQKQKEESKKKKIKKDKPL